MQKVLFSIFVALGYLFRALKQPAAWAVIAVVAGLIWVSRRHAETAKVVHKHPPIQFKPLAPAPVKPEGGAAAGPTPGITFAPSEETDSLDPDPEKRPIMSSRDLEVAVGRFHKDNLRLPKDADELIEQKYLVGVPPAPPGKRYLLDLSPIRMRLVSK
ncbi:MAG: hypothetical protein WCS99_03020 [Limisphaerales bacterium]